MIRYFARVLPQTLQSALYNITCARLYKALLAKTSQICVILRLPDDNMLYIVRNVHLLRNPHVTSPYGTSTRNLVPRACTCGAHGNVFDRFEAIVLNPSGNKKQYEKRLKRHRLCTVFALVYVHTVLFLEAFYRD